MSQIFLCIKRVTVCIDKGSLQRNHTNRTTFTAKKVGAIIRLPNEGITDYTFAVTSVSYIIEVATITRWPYYRGIYIYRGFTVQLMIFQSILSILLYIIIIMLLQHLPTYLGGLPKVGSECGAWPESGWPVDQVMMGMAFFQPF